MLKSPGMLYVASYHCVCTIMLQLYVCFGGNECQCEVNSFCKSTDCLLSHAVTVCMCMCVRACEYMCVYQFIYCTLQICLYVLIIYVCSIRDIHRNVTNCSSNAMHALYVSINDTIIAT